MRFFVEYISGDVPGGFLVLFFLLFTVNVALYYLYKSSKLFDKQVYKRRAIRSNVFLVGLYIFLWFYLRPASLPDRIIFLPAGNENPPEILYAEILQENLDDRLDDDVRMHRWEWLYQTANPDSFHLGEYRKSLAARTGIETVIEYTITGMYQLECRFISDGNSSEAGKITGTSFVDVAQKVIRWLISTGNIVQRNRVAVIEKDDTYWQTWTRAKWSGLQPDREELSGIINPEDRRTKTLLAELELVQGIRLSRQNNRSTLTTTEVNPHFQRMMNWLIPYGREEQDNAQMNIVLGRLYLHKENYSLAEICLKRALTQDPFNPRVYYYMSFLHPSRIFELGYKNRVEILEHTVRLDPGYVNAVYELANELYTTGTGTSTGYSTTRARELLKSFLNINPSQPRILSLLGRIYLQTKYTLEAQAIFKRLVGLYPDSAENHYNLGVTNYQLKEYDEAELNFRRAMDLEDHLESYLYMGAINSHRKDYDRALYYYRERIKRKQGDEDYYAREAMRQVRIILDILADSSGQGADREVPVTGN